MTIRALLVSFALCAQVFFGEADVHDPQGLKVHHVEATAATPKRSLMRRERKHPKNSKQPSGAPVQLQKIASKSGIHHKPHHKLHKSHHPSSLKLPHESDVKLFTSVDTKSHSESRPAVVARSAPNGYCHEGIYRLQTNAMGEPEHICCHATCGSCGGTGCESFPGGADRCCPTNIVASGKQCNSYIDTNCVISDPPILGSNTYSACNEFDCVAPYYHRHNASDIRCWSNPCTIEKDRDTCCVKRSQEMTGKWCKGSQKLNWIDNLENGLDGCTKWALNNGRKFFVYGTGDASFNLHVETNTEKCYWQDSDAPETCTGESCCSCTNCTVEAQTFNFYKVGPECAGQAACVGWYNPKDFPAGVTR